MDDGDCYSDLEGLCQKNNKDNIQLSYQDAGINSSQDTFSKQPKHGYQNQEEHSCLL